MKQRLVIFGVALLAGCWVTAALTQPAPKPAAKRAPAPPAAYKAQGFAPGFDDMMTMLVQPRHTKLYYAGAAKNWELAAAENRDLRQAFDNLAKAIPQYEGNDVPQAVKGFVTGKLDAVDAAIASADAARFSGAYKDLTAGCNDCHHYMEHPFLVIKAPDAAQYPDQDFKPETN